MPTLKETASAAPLAPQTDAPTPPDASATKTSIALTTADPVFAALCKRASEDGTASLFLVALPPSELLETLQQLAYDVVVLDVDGQDPAAVKLLATKVMLVSDAPIILVSAYLAPGSAGLGTLLQSIAARFVQKPRGPSSLSLAGVDGPLFMAALQTAFAEYKDEVPDSGADPGEAADDDVDAGWDIEEEPTVAQAGADD